MAGSAERLERGPTESPKQFIEKLRRVKFKIGTGATCTLAPDLHRTITQLSVELYQNDVHFIKEIVQNAEDNKYAEDVSPSLEFQLIEEDLAKVGAPATLVILNNELGLRTEDVVALSSAGKSTKIGKRNEGFIGCKGIGFKSVFMICETPIIISNGYRIQFRAEPGEEAGVGYIVPEWIESPSNEKILSAIGRDELATTMTILPIKDTKVELVQKQLKEISPETILFLKRIRELNVADKTKQGVNYSRKIKRSKPVFGITSNVCKFSEVTLSVETSEGKVGGRFPYFIFQRGYPVTHEVQERKEVGEWTLTLAFPKQGRPSSGQVGDVFSFLPTELRTGFPFILNADFLLTTSRETIRFDSPWNIGILECIPAAFELSFKIMVGARLPQEITRIAEAYPHWSSNHAYEFLPHNTVLDGNRYNSPSEREGRQVRQKLSSEPKEVANVHKVEKVRTKIFQALEGKPLVQLCNLCSSNRNEVHFRSARDCVLIKSSFHTILKKAAVNHHLSPSVLSISPGGSSNPGKGFAIVDESVQKNYASRLAVLGVPEMTLSQYMSFLRDSEWLLSLQENLYLEVLAFFAYELNIPEGSAAARELLTIKYLKIRGEKSKAQLGSFEEFSGSELLYTSCEVHAEWMFAWAKEFEPWYPLRIMPTETAKALQEARNSKALILWISRHGSLTELSLEKYAEKIIEKLVLTKPTYESTSFSLLVLQFLHSGIRKGWLSPSKVIKTLQREGYVSVVVVNAGFSRNVNLKLKDEEGRVLLPRSCSKWPILFSLSEGDRRLITELSDEYLEPRCSLEKDVVTRSSGPDSMVYFLKRVFNAVDIPDVKLPANKDFSFRHPATMEKSVLMFQWLKAFLPRRKMTKHERENDRLLTSIKTLQWVKTCEHGWQSPSSVFLSVSHFENHFTAHDLPLLDVSAYSPDLTESEIRVVLQELGVVTNMRKGCAVAKYFFSCTADKLDPAIVKRFYSYLYKVHWEADEDQDQDQDEEEDEDKVVQSGTVWTPATDTRSQPMWRAPSECIICDELDIFKDCDDVSILDQLYDKSLLSFFSDKMHVPKKASVDLYCMIWLKWSNSVTGFKGEQLIFQCVSLAKVRSVWKTILEDWEKIEEDDWKSFCSSAWVPVAPLSVEELGETISIVPPNQAVIADDLALAESFSKVADGILNFAWVLPGLSRKQGESLVKLYSEIGVRKLSKIVTYQFDIPEDVWKRKLPWGKGLINEGLLRCMLAYLSKHGVRINRRKQVLAGLISASEVVISEPFAIRSTLDIETLTSPATITKVVFSHYDTRKRKLYYLRGDHALLEERAFNANLVTEFSLGILSNHPKLVAGLKNLLKRLYDLGFAMKFVEYELRAHKLSVSREDEKMLVEKLASRQQPKQRLECTRLAKD